MLKFWWLSLILTLGFATVFSACKNNDDSTKGKVDEIVERGTLLVGTTGDYRPLTFRESDGTYWGFCIEMAQEIANDLGVETTFVPTSWPTLTADVLAEPFTHGEIGVLKQKGQEDLLQVVNNKIQKMKADSSLLRLHEKYGMIYAY